MIVLGIDPGSRRCGYGVVERERARLRVVESGVLVPGALPLAIRLGRILDGLEALVARARPGEVSLESVFSGASPRSALVLGQARGVALAVAARAGLPVFEYAPAEVKLAFTGNGRAGKDQMLRTARMLLGVAPDLSDEADALALAVCHLARRPLQLPGAGQRAAAAAARLVPARRDHRRAP
ncbi:crossover junction endodeoxyribonuclease RuvC [Anaeromyxobacter oryzisoli]|uniref:crossover junction endodeoxyribonuclease RuvC n=1 Tax=Anaeromyxobacter oryzisoli TaxID=2925408 RepID=UPI001F569193|nr:crossover junction endodeoxyribonuclease RuvC [Anaeromyxobacter sp. SG63]